jgi:hypothetical protein
VSLPCSKSPTANFGVLRRQKRPIYWRCVYYRATSNHAARLGRRVQLHGVNSIAFGAALWFLRLLPSHLYCLCYRTCISEAQGVLGNGGASDLDIPGTMSLESVGVLKLQVCSGQLISGGRSDSQQNANGCTVGVLEAPGASKHWRCLWYRGIGTVPSGSAGGVHLWT